MLVVLVKRKKIKNLITYAVRTNVTFRFGYDLLKEEVYGLVGEYWSAVKRKLTR